MGVFGTQAELAKYDGSTTILGILTAFFTWATLYFTLCLFNSKRSYEWNCRIIATVHAVAVVFMAYWVGFVQGSWPFTDAGAPNTKLQHWICSLSLGYFTWDFIWCLYFQTEDSVMLLHHVLSMYANLHVIYTGYDGIEVVATIFLAEISNPFLQFRWFFRSCNAHHSWAAEINDLTFIAVFGFMRTIVGTYFLYTTLSASLSDRFIKFGACAIYIISWIFWIMIVKYAYRKYTKIFNDWKRKNVANKTHFDTGFTKEHTSGPNYSSEELVNRINTEKKYDTSLYVNGHVLHDKNT